jgi:hypothetical protein
MVVYQLEWWSYTLKEIVGRIGRKFQGSRLNWKEGSDGDQDVMYQWRWEVSPEGAIIIRLYSAFYLYCQLTSTFLPVLRHHPPNYISTPNASLSWSGLLMHPFSSGWLFFLEYLDTENGGSKLLKNVICPLTQHYVPGEIKQRLLKCTIILEL